MNFAIIPNDSHSALAQRLARNGTGWKLDRIMLFIRTGVDHERPGGKRLVDHQRRKGAGRLQILISLVNIVLAVLPRVLQKDPDPDTA